MHELTKLIWKEKWDNSEAVESIITNWLEEKAKEIEHTPFTSEGCYYAVSKILGLSQKEPSNPDNWKYSKEFIGQKETEKKCMTANYPSVDEVKEAIQFLACKAKHEYGEPCMETGEKKSTALPEKWADKFLERANKEMGRHSLTNDYMRATIKIFAETITDYLHEREGR